ncbi:hypothetical protein T4A_9986 [Trichinella pseudospiralis]|uniref:Uncharacterized protein n=1 Tax=Trichinella pseudospiralis TaxID=6337 RepID=A0A0V1DR32_TRIPS|nr:hypothetical protein T4A_9769 [Trichinella pseudospiralis]KRY63995.1 hypothetical protein T4A_9986 [Trichinella pseudospiralis]
MKKKEEKWRKLSALQSWIGWIESFVGQLRSLVSCVCWSNCGKYRHFGEDTIYRSRVRNKRPILRYFLAMMIM